MKRRDIFAGRLPGIFFFWRVGFVCLKVLKKKEWIVELCERAEEVTGAKGFYEIFFSLRAFICLNAKLTNELNIVP